MADKAIYILAGYDSDTEQYLSSLQNALYEAGFSGQQTKNIPQHITLDSFSVEMEQKLIARLQTLAEEVCEIPVTFHHIGIFSGSKVLFVAPDTNRELLELKELFGPLENWTPHTTMLIDEPEIILQAASILLERFSPFSGKVTALHLYEFWPTRHILSVDLKMAAN
ncbi:MAG: 2'-5' RNA ligase family protein [Acutalibacter sp.]|nr:2'-5' RNA ligase family protein [Acutalibacter sp.]